MRQVLIIDDEDDIIGFLDQFLSSLGYEVTAANSGEEGIDIFDNGPDYDLAITDINLLGMDGNAVAKHIKNSGKADVPILAMSGYDEEPDRQLFNFSLHKPFSLKALADVFKAVEAGSRAAST